MDRFLQVAKSLGVTGVDRGQLGQRVRRHDTSLGQVAVGDTALVEWSERLDRVTPITLVVSQQQIAAAYDQVDAELVAAMAQIAAIRKLKGRA